MYLVSLTYTINVPGAHVPLMHPQCIILVVKSLQLHIGITSSSREMILITISLQHLLHHLPLTLKAQAAPAPIILHDGDPPLTSNDSTLVQKVCDIILKIIS